MVIALLSLQMKREGGILIRTASVYVFKSLLTLYRPQKPQEIMFSKLPLTSSVSILLTKAAFIW